MHRVTILPPPGSSWLHCNQRGLVNSLMPLNLYGLSLLKMDSFVQGRSLVSCILQQSFPLGVPLHILQRCFHGFSSPSSAA
uniref:Uncharacterized protein n=1 Tax=Aegilops tauschii subsp. strangulata TaxID=200361 RepID=A0A453S560_AEGTS